MLILTFLTTFVCFSFLNILIPRTTRYNILCKVSLLSIPNVLIHNTVLMQFCIKLIYSTFSSLYLFLLEIWKLWVRHQDWFIQLIIPENKDIFLILKIQILFVQFFINKFLQGIVCPRILPMIWSAQGEIKNLQN